MSLAFASLPSVLTLLTHSWRCGLLTFLSASPTQAPGIGYRDVMRTQARTDTHGRVSASVRVFDLTRLRCVLDYQIECSGRGFAEAGVAVQRDRNANRGIVAGETEAAFH